MLRKYIAKLLFLLFITHNLHANTEDYEKIQKLLNSYPNYLSSYKNNHIIWHDGHKMPFDDFLENKTHQELLKNPSLKDQLSIDYIKVSENKFYIPKKNEDSGRFRHYNFFKKMYGNNKNEIEKNLTEIKWMPNTTNKTFLVTTVNDVHKKLTMISKELDKLPNSLKKFVDNPSGIYKYRKIAKTNRLSTHSFGISIDINLNKSNYWLWDKKKNDFKYKNLIPLKIVKIFEKYGFIWGGRWYHYDTMHFEYRPELLN